ncbi:acyltransferase family protein [soil metagenome]
MQEGAVHIWDWHVKSPHPVETLKPLMVLTNPWRLPLLFLVSGAATRFMADKMTAGALLRQRMWRLLPPLLFGIVVVVPPQTYEQVTRSLHQSIGPAEFYARYLTASGHWVDPHMGGAIMTPTWNHLWFVAYLAVYSAILCAVLAVGRGGVERVRGLGERLFAHSWAVLLVPMAGAIATRMILVPRFHDTHAMVGDWNVHAESALPFLFGYLFGKSEAVWNAIARARRPALMLAVLGYLGVAVYQIAYPTYDAPAWVYPASRFAFGVDQWASVVAILGFARVHLGAVRDGPIRRYLTDAIFSFYIVHQTIIVLAAPWLVGLGLPQGLEATLLIAITTLGCFATYEAVRRVQMLRPVFGLSWRPKPQLQASARAAARPFTSIPLAPAGEDAI